MQFSQPDSAAVMPEALAGNAGEVTADRRKGERLSLLRRVIIIAERRRFDGYTIDVSRGGISFIAAGEIPLGPTELQIPELNSFLKGNVVDIEANDPRRLRRYHLQFITPLDRSEIERMTQI